MNQYLALLRGINVGGKNLIKMPALKACFEGLGFEDVRAYIMSMPVYQRMTIRNWNTTTKLLSMMAPGGTLDSRL